MRSEERGLDKILQESFIIPTWKIMEYKDHPLTSEYTTSKGMKPDRRKSIT